MATYRAHHHSLVLRGYTPILGEHGVSLDVLALENVCWHRDLAGTGQATGPGWTVTHIQSGLGIMLHLRTRALARSLAEHLEQAVTSWPRPTSRADAPWSNRKPVADATYAWLEANPGARIGRMVR